ncbi:MAG: synthase subunit [Verrucomicrobiota bacterium]
MKKVCEIFHKVLATHETVRFSRRSLELGKPSHGLRFHHYTQSAIRRMRKSGHRSRATIFRTMIASFKRSLSAVSGAVRFFALMGILAVPAMAADTAAHAEQHGLPTAAPKLYFGFINNSMIATWLVAALVIFGARRAMANAREVPEGGQNFWEFLVEGLHNFLAGILGPKLVKDTFWFFATIFIFIVATNWFGLLPGVGTIGWSAHYDAASPHIFGHVEKPLLRGGNADLNMTSAMAVSFFVWWIVWALRENGPVGLFKHIFAPKGKDSGFMKFFMIAIFGMVGVLELISILFRPVSLSFRLFGNIFAGETTLESMQALVPALGWLIPIPFYFLELLVGMVQALVFMLLTSVFTLLICEHHEEHHDEEHGEGEKGHAH